MSVAFNHNHAREEAALIRLITIFKPETSYLLKFAWIAPVQTLLAKEHKSGDKLCQLNITIATQMLTQVLSYMYLQQLNISYYIFVSM